MRRVSMLDLKGEYALFADEVGAAVNSVLESQRFIGGPEVGELESALARRLGVDHAVAVSSGTDALLCAMMALGIGPGDEVILPPLTFFATAGSMARLGARPVFVDVDPRTFNLDPEKLAPAVTERTKAIVVVHLYGQCADMDAVREVAVRYGLPVVEDAAQSIGATYKGQAAGTMGALGCMSFYPTKNLGGFGEGGMIFTNDNGLAQLARQLRHHGESQRYVHERVGGNFRLDTLKAAVLLVKLRRLDEFTERRRTNARLYDALLQELPVTTPFVGADQFPVYHQYTILCDQRDALAAFLHERGVDTAVYYPVPLHLQTCFAALGYSAGAFPVTEAACERVLSLPCHPMLTEEDVRYVAECIHDYFASPSRRRADVRTAMARE